MTDLHKPLGPKESPAGASRWPIAFVGLLGIIVLALLGYWAWQSSRSDSVVVSLNEPQPAAKNPKPAEPAANSTEPLETVPAPEPPTSTGGNTKTPEPPVFKPQQTVLKKRDAWQPVPDLIEPSEYGPLPRVGTSGLRPLDAYSQSPGAIGGARIAIVVGGLGISQTGTKQAIEQLPSSITLAYSPAGNSLQRWMQVARKQGHEVVLQIPMEPLGYPEIDPGRGTLVSTAAQGENLSRLRWSLGRMSNYPLVINYLGANFSNQEKVLRPILEEIKARGLGWMDDGTVRASKSLDIAEAIRLPHVNANFVLDARQEPARIDAQLKALELLARRRGYAIATATAFPLSVKQIAAWVKEAEKNGLQIVPVSNLLRDYK